MITVDNVGMVKNRNVGKSPNEYDVFLVECDRILTKKDRINMSIDKNKTQTRINNILKREVFKKINRFLNFYTIENESNELKFCCRIYVGRRK